MGLISDLRCSCTQRLFIAQNDDMSNSVEGHLTPPENESSVGARVTGWLQGLQTANKSALQGFGIPLAVHGMPELGPNVSALPLALFSPGLTSRYRCTCPPG
jgi:hypothetical protein